MIWINISFIRFLTLPKYPPVLVVLDMLSWGGLPILPRWLIEIFGAGLECRAESRGYGYFEKKSFRARRVPFATSEGCINARIPPQKYTLPETNMFAPEHGCLEYYSYFPFGFRPIFRCELLVSGSVPIFFWNEILRQLRG